MKRIFHFIFILLLMFPAVSCSWVEEMDDPKESLPEGTPITISIPFGAKEMLDVQVGTKVEASAVDESRVHDLYVLIFNNAANGEKIYGRYFSYQHQEASLAALNSSNSECWYVDNKKFSAQTGEVIGTTSGAVKLSTVACANAKVVVIANIDNAVMNLNGEDAFTCLNAINSWSELQQVTVRLEQDVVQRKDLFLMTGIMDGVNTSEMRWNRQDNQSQYNPNYKLRLYPVDAKVKFKVKVNSTNISDVRPVYWQVCNTPRSSFLFSEYDPTNPPNVLQTLTPPGDVSYFESEKTYFEGTETDNQGNTYHVFCFYMLESSLPYSEAASNYYQREKNVKIPTDEGGYNDDDHEYYVKNGGWKYAPANAPYVFFDMVLTLTDAGIQELNAANPNIHIGHALTSDAKFTIHLGDFTSSTSGNFDDYSTYRATSYTYTVTVNNISSIYTEVTLDQENQAGQEGYLLLTDDEIVNADAHYEYHQLTFSYRPTLVPELFSWYVKTPFGQGGPVFKRVNGKPTYDCDGLDYLWVKFGVNEREDDGAGRYTVNRHAYPGASHYHPEWEPGMTVNDDDGQGNKSVPDLMDITQLIQYIFSETEKETAYLADNSNPESAFIFDNPLITDPENPEYKPPVIRVTAFIDEYYYEKHPITGNADPDLWRQFINAQPREMHILSDARASRDKQSDVILSSHSIIQQSIQTIYNIYAPGLRTLWGTEHLDEMKALTTDENGYPVNCWTYWPQNCPDGNKKKAGANTDLGKENGRVNTAFIWGLYSSQAAGGNDVTTRRWTNFLNYSVNNSTPELLSGYQGLAWSCMTRNRDNNGNGVIDREEIRWYMAATNQLVGMWVGNESLSLSARLYQPAKGHWRAHVVSSTNYLVSWAEEGGGSSDMSYDWAGSSSTYHTWDSEAEAAAGESVRCVRNIGTYDDGGLKDISEAPYETEVEKFFTVAPIDNGNPLTGYVFNFNNLNTKSIRAYSEGELPYHDQMSISNCVYASMVTQSLADDVPQYSKKLGEINNEVTALGYNPYCPAGYRFPNQSEMLLMMLYLPSTYYMDKEGEHYLDNQDKPYTIVFPTRTYYDKGYFGSLKSDTEPWSTEKGKVGWLMSGKWNENNEHVWSFPGKMHCSPYNEIIKHSRCVADREMTGTITGDFIFDGNTICPDDTPPITLNFASTGSALNAASITLCYTASNGNYREVSIPVEKMPTGSQYSRTQKMIIPSLASLGINPDENLHHEMELVVEVGNISNNTLRVSQTIYLVNNAIEGNFTVEDSSIYPGDDKGAIVSFDFTSKAYSIPLNDLSLELVVDDVPYALTVAKEPSGRTFKSRQAIEIPTPASIGLLPSALPKAMTLRATITSEDGTDKTVDLPVTLRSHIRRATVEFPTVYDSVNDAFPIGTTFSLINDRTEVTGVSLSWKQGNGAYSAPVPLTINGDNVSTQEISTSSLGISLAGSTTYKFKVTVSCSDGTTLSSVRSVEVMHHNQNWNPGPWDANSTVSQINKKWNPQQINNLDFGEGDFIDAFIDVSNCPYIYKDGTAGNDIGMDLLATIAVTASSMEWDRSHEGIFLYYPAHIRQGGAEGDEQVGEDRLQIAVLDGPSGASTVTRVRPFTLLPSVTTLSFRLSQDSFQVNGITPDWSQVRAGNNNSGSYSRVRSEAAIHTITSQTSLKIGSKEGAHRSRATYNYVRVIRHENE